MNFSAKVIFGLTLGIDTGVFLGELVEPLKVVADGFVRLLQMTVLPYVVLPIMSSLGSLDYAGARQLFSRAGAVLVLLWLVAICFGLLFPLAFPDVESASFYSPSMAERGHSLRLSKRQK